MKDGQIEELTMVLFQTTIMSEIGNYINSNGGVLSEWYVGITTDPKERLFTDHSVSETDGRWIYRACQDSSTAREIERSLISKGAKGGSGGGDYSSKYIYAYKITSYTKE